MAMETWEVDGRHSGIYFSVRHMVVAKVRGRFAKFRGTLLAEDGDLGRASLDVVIDATSVETGVEDRDAHLRSAEFFDAVTYPDITFKGTRVDGLGRARLLVAGDLTLRGVMHEVVLEVDRAGRTKDPWGNERTGFTAKTSIDREAFGLTWNQLLDSGDLMLGRYVDVEVEVEAVRRNAYDQRLLQVADRLERSRTLPRMQAGASWSLDNPSTGGNP